MSLYYKRAAYIYIYPIHLCCASAVKHTAVDVGRQAFPLYYESHSVVAAASSSGVTLLLSFFFCCQTLYIWRINITSMAGTVKCVLSFQHNTVFFFAFACSIYCGCCMPPFEEFPCCYYNNSIFFFTYIKKGQQRMHIKTTEMAVGVVVKMRGLRKEKRNGFTA